MEVIKIEFFKSNNSTTIEFLQSSKIFSRILVGFKISCTILVNIQVISKILSILTINLVRMYTSYHPYQKD